MIIVLAVVLYMLLQSHHTHHHHQVEVDRLFQGTFLSSFNLHSYSIILFLSFQFKSRRTSFMESTCDSPETPTMVPARGDLCVKLFQGEMYVNNCTTK